MEEYFKEQVAATDLTVQDLTVMTMIQIREMDRVKLLLGIRSRHPRKSPRRNLKILLINRSISLPKLHEKSTECKRSLNSCRRRWRRPGGNSRK